MSAPWLLLRQARVALKNGRPDVALELLEQLQESGHKAAWKLAAEVARGFVERAQRHLRVDDDVDAAWEDLLAAERLEYAGPDGASLREALTRLALAELRALLELGKPAPALDALAYLRERGVRHPDLAVVQEAAQGWLLAQEQADRGDFLLSLQGLERLRERLPGRTTGLDRFRGEVERRHETFRHVLARVHDALAAGNWSEVLRAADEAVAVAPHNREVHQIRAKAWENLQQATVLHLGMPPSSGGGSAEQGPAKRFLLWIDGVGGYLVCLGTRVAIGQATEDGPVDVPVLADISRVHATLTRDGEGYLLEADRTALVNGAEVEKALLQPEDRVTLGRTCQFVFTRPLAVSGTALVRLASGHRFPWAIDGVILMAQNILLGPPGQAHIPVPGLGVPVVLDRGPKGLVVQYPGEYWVDGERARDRTPIAASASVNGEWFSFSLEPVPARSARGDSGSRDPFSPPPPTSGPGGGAPGVEDTFREEDRAKAPARRDE